MSPASYSNSAENGNPANYLALHTMLATYLSGNYSEEVKQPPGKSLIKYFQLATRWNYETDITKQIKESFTHK